MRTRIIFTAISVLILFGNVYGIIINVPGDSLTIQSAINGASTGDTVLVAEGHYYERIDFIGKDIFLTSNYLYTSDTLSIQNTIIDADTTVLGVSDTMSVIVFCNGETSDAVVQGFTIQNGSGFNYNGIDRWFGGGIYCDNASPTIKHNIIRQNSVAHGGGGLCGMNSANVTVTHNTFTENHAGKSGGGGIMVYNSFSVISYNDIIANTTDTTSLDQYDLGMGGGIYSCNSQMDGSNTITHNTISENIACTGGGICSYVLSADIVSDNEICNNIATGENNNSTSTRRMRGGGISLYHTFHGMVVNNVISNNYAGSCGGGIHAWLNHAVNEAHIDNNVIIGNISTGVGGGICTEEWLDNGFITGNLLAENVAINGAGISFLESNGTIMGNTIANNSASNNGGSLHGYSTTGQKLVEVTNTICWGNETEIWNQSNTQFVVTYCDIEGDSTGTGNIDADPLFANPENCDFHLNWTNFPISDSTKSPCIDAGDPSSPYDPDETIADMGAFYFNQSQVTQQITLSSGYSFVSSHIIPDNSDMLIVMAPVLNDNLDFVRNSLGQTLLKIGPNWVNGIGNWIVDEGYLVKMFADDSFTIMGTPVDPTTPIPVATGFQFVSYFPEAPMDALLAFETIIGDDLDFVRNSQGQTLRKIGPNWVNGIGDCQSGEGYLVKMFAAGEIIYPVAAKSSGKITAVPTHFIFEGGNPAEAVYTLYLEGLQVGDVVAAYDGDIMVGATRINSLNAFENELPVFSTLITSKGYEEGNQIILKVWSENNIVSVDFTMEAIYNSYVSDLYPGKDGEYSVVNFTKVSSIPNKEIVVYPNPFSESTVISYQLTESSKIMLKIYNISGQEIRTLVNEKQPAGNHSIVWNGTDGYGESVESGIYFYKLNINNKLISTKKMILFK